MYIERPRRITIKHILCFMCCAEWYRRSCPPISYDLLWVSSSIVRPTVWSHEAKLSRILFQSTPASLAISYTLRQSNYGDVRYVEKKTMSIIKGYIHKKMSICSESTGIPHYFRLHLVMFCYGINNTYILYKDWSVSLKHSQVKLRYMYLCALPVSIWVQYVNMSGMGLKIEELTRTSGMFHNFSWKVQRKCG